MENLQDLKKNIKEQVQSIDIEKAREKAIMAKIGQVVYESSNKDDLPENMVRDIAHGLEEIQVLEDLLRDLLNCEDKEMLIADESKALNVELRNLKHKTQSEYEELAKTAWECWKSGQKIQGLEEALSEMIKASERSEAVDSAIKKNAKLSDNLGSSILSTGRALFLSGRKKTVSMIMQKLWGSTGLQIYNTVELDVFVGTPVEESINKLNDIKMRKQEIQNRLIELGGEKEAIAETIGKFSGKGSVAKRIAGVETDLKKNQADMQSLFENLGLFWVKEKNLQDINNKTFKNLKAQLDEIYNNLESLEEGKKAYESHIEYLNKVNDREKQELKVKTLDEKVKKIQSDLKAEKKILDSQTKELDREKQNLAELPKRPGL